MNARSLLLGAALGCAAAGPIILSACSSVPQGDASPLADEPREEVGQEASDEVVEAAPTPVVTRPRRAGIALRHVPGVTPDITPACKSPSLSYYQGPIIMAPVIVPVFWSSAVNSEVIQKMADFYGDITQTGYWTWLHEYDTSMQSGGTVQSILPGSLPAAPFNTGVTLVPSKCPTTSSCKLTDAQLQSELNAQITAGKLPEPTVDCSGNTSTVYMVHFPPNVTLSGPSGSGTSCVQFCGYHNTGTITASGTASGKPLIYAALMDSYSGGCASGCGVNPATTGNTAAFNNQTSISSHELAEATTDPDIGLLPDSAPSIAAPVGWYDENNSCGEIGDICDVQSAGPTIVGAHGTWTVQYLWSNKQGACVDSGTAETLCSGSTTTNCLQCSCGDNNGGCPNGGTCGTNGACSAGSCTPLTACPSGQNCGTASNGCGGTLTCGTCASGQTCTNNVCTGGCTPLTVCPSGQNCGTASNGCGGTLSCGTCAAGETCTGNVCTSTCVPLTSCPSGQDCGTASNGCGGTLNCGTCPSGQTCGSNNACSGPCVPLTACPSGAVCGDINDGCGGAVFCGFCASNQICTANNTCLTLSGTSSSSGGTTTSTSSSSGTSGTASSSSSGSGGGCLATCPSDAVCGTMSNNCGGMLYCGSCASGETCGSDNTCGASGTGAGGNASTGNGDGSGNGSSGTGASNGGTGQNSGCGCKTAGDSEGSPASSMSALGLLALAGFARARRRRAA